MGNKINWQALLIAFCAALSTTLCVIIGRQSAQALSAAGGVFATASTESLTHAIMLACASIGAVAGIWVFFSYVALVRATHMGGDGALVRLALRFATPAVRRTLAGLAVSSALVVAPAAADSGFLTTGPDLGWGASRSQIEPSPDLSISSESDIPINDADTSLTFDDINDFSPLISGSSQPNLDSSEENHEQYTVIPGDTLWSIAAQHLPSDANPADIAAATDAWFLTNNDQISHPHMIHPGQVFTSPRTSP